METNKTEYALLHLMRCALHNTPPEPIPELDYEQLYALCVSQSVVAMIAMALESGGLLTERFANPECIKKWKDARNNAIRKNILMDVEREQILQHFEEQGIWYLLLKGAILKDIYPKMGMRQMADNDILFDPAYQHQIKAYMERRGYKTVSFDQGNHDVYEKPPVYNFELHIALFNEYLHEEWVDYYENIKLRLKKDEGNHFGFHFSDEDFYVYLLTHGYKHYSGGGTGIRFLSDIYVFLKEKADSMNWEYTFNELRTLKLYEFESNIRKLAEKVFGTDGLALTDEEEKIVAYLMGAGTYGTMENWINQELDRLQNSEGPVTGWTKLRYMWKRMFPDRKYMEEFSPICRKYKWTLPFLWIYRLIRGLVLWGDKIIKELKMLRNAE